MILNGNSGKKRKYKKILKLDSNLWPLSLQTDALPLSQIAIHNFFAKIWEYILQHIMPVSPDGISKIGDSYRKIVILLMKITAIFIIKVVNIIVL